MAVAPIDELHFLTEALKAHVEWTQSTGGHGLPACDETWLQARREHYRRTEYVADEQPSEVERWDVTSDATAATASTPLDGNPLPSDASLASDLARPSMRASEIEAPVPSPSLKVAQPRIVNTDAPVSVVAPPVPAAVGSAGARAKAPSSVGLEVSALVDNVGLAVNDVQPPRASRHAVSPIAHPAGPTESYTNLSVEERRTRLSVLENEVRQCRSCSLCEARTNTVFARGDGSSGVAFVGEGPGADEDAQGYPFVGAAGQLLDKMIAAMGLDRETVYVCNIVKCRPPNNRKPSEEEMATCRHFVVSQLELIQPRVIVALGATAVEGLLGLKLGITRMRGSWRLYKGSIPVMPTFHPAYLLRQPDAKRDVWEDLQAVLTRINMPLPQRRK